MADELGTIEAIERHFSSGLVSETIVQITRNAFEWLEGSDAITSSS